jgi:hypothetical protein
MSGNATYQALSPNLRGTLYFSKLYLRMENTGMSSNLRRFDVARRIASYAVSAIVASLVYIVWFVVDIRIDQRGSPDPGFRFDFGFAFIFSLIGGFALALLIMTIPWAIALWAHLKTRWDGRIYFPAVGGLLVFTLGCVAASISPKPLFIEDQTFLEGAVITAQRQGPCLLISGIAFGACYWWLERRIRASS